jgi:putative spermidine/putrescine transport system permease protein
MARRIVGIATIGVLVFLYLPILTIFLYAFNADRGQSWPITEWTTHWFGDAIGNQDVQNAFLLSLEAAIGATLLALVLGAATLKRRTA